MSEIATDFEATYEQYGVVRIERWPEGLVFWVGGEIRWKSWESARRASEEAHRISVWPDFAAPPKYDNPAPGWEDPRLPDFRLIWKSARELGYAIGLHGSMKRDCDLIAVPWVSGAAPSSELIASLCVALNARQVGEVERKPLGRIAVFLQVDGYVKGIDLSIVEAVEVNRRKGDPVTRLHNLAEASEETSGVYATAEFWRLDDEVTRLSQVLGRMEERAEKAESALSSLQEAHRRSAGSFEEMAQAWLEGSPYTCRQCGGPLPNPDCGNKANGVYPCCQPQVEDNVASLASLLAQVRAQAISEERKRRGENT